MCNLQSIGHAGEFSVDSDELTSAQGHSTGEVADPFGSGSALRA